MAPPHTQTVTRTAPTVQLSSNRNLKKYTRQQSCLLHIIYRLPPNCYTLLHDPSTYNITGPKVHSARVTTVPQVQRVVTTDVRHQKGSFRGCAIAPKLWCCVDLQYHNVATTFRDINSKCVCVCVCTHAHTHTHTHTHRAHFNNLISLFKTEGTSKQSSYTLLCSFVAVLTVSVNMQEVTSNIVYLHYISIGSTNLFALQSQALLHMTPCVDPL